MKRKFTLLMLLLFALLAGANLNKLSAQIDLSKTYRIKVDYNGNNAYATGQYLTDVGGSLAFQSLNESNSGQQFTFEPTGNADQYYIKSAAGGYVYCSSSTEPVGTGANKSVITVKANGTAYTFASNGIQFAVTRYSMGTIVTNTIVVYCNGGSIPTVLWALEAIETGDSEQGGTNNVVTIGSGDNTDNTMPTRPSSDYSATQQIYTASEIKHAAGAITKIALRGENPYGVTRTWEVYLANTDKTAFSSKDEWVTSNLVKVFDGQVTVPSTAAWFELELTNNFNYEGNSIALCVIDKTGSGGSGVKFYTFAGSSLSVRGSSPYDINSLPAAGYQNTFKNQIQLTFSDGKHPGVPQNLTVTSTTQDAVALAWDEAENADKYIVYKDGVKVGETENTSYVVTGLNLLTDYTFTVTAVHESEESAQSNAVTATTTSAVPTRDIVFELQDSYGDGWTGNYIEVYYNDEIDPRYTLQNENLDGQNNNTSGGEMQSKTLSIPEGTKVRVEYIVHVLSGNWSSPDENNIKIYYKDGSCINGKSSAEANGNDENGKDFQVVEFVVGENTACLAAPDYLYIVSGDAVLYPEETIQIKWTVPNADVLSYNVYCNDVLIGNVADASYDLTVDKCDVSYNNIAVSAVYAEGESAKSDPLQIQVPRYFELTINVTNNGNPVADATVVLSGGKDDTGNYPAPRTFTTDANGQVIANVLSIMYNAGDTYKITVTKDMFDTGYDEFGWYETQFSNVTRNIVLEMEGPKNVVATPSNLFVGESTTITWDAVASGSATYNVYVDGVKHNTQPITTNQYAISDLSYNANPGHVVAVTAVYAAGETSRSTVDVKVAGTFTLTVNVTNDQGMPIQGATVSLDTDEWTEDELGNKIASYGTKTTDANGQAVYQNVKLLVDPSQAYSGYTVNVSKGLFGSSFQYVTNYMTITNGENFNLNFPMSLPVPENVDTDADSYEADDDAVLTWAAPQGFAAEVLGYNIYKVEYDNGGSSQTKLNDALVTDLTYTVEDVEAGQYYLGVSAVYAEGESRATTCYISVVGRGRLVGTVVNAQSEPINGADIVVHGYDISGNPVRFEGIKTNANGRFVIEPIPASNNDGYTIEAKALGYYDYVSDASNNAHVTLDGETKVTVMMRSEPFVDIEVTAIDRDTYADVHWDKPMTGGLVTKSADLVRLDVASGVTTNLATDLDAQDYQDADWNSLPNGEYKYGVTLLIEEEKQHFYENFETIEDIVLKGEDPNKWSKYELNTNGTLANSDRGRWNIVKSEPGVFTAPDNGSVACSPNAYGDNYPTRYIMVSPLIDLREAYLPQLSFSYYTPKDSNGTANGLKVLVMTESQGKMGAAEAEQLWDNDEKYTEGFVKQVVDLKDYVGEKIYLVFDTKLNYMKTYVDLIEVKSQKVEWESRITWSNSLVKGAVVFTGTGNWNDAARWSSGAVPAKTDDAVIKGQATIDGTVEINSVNVARNESAVGGMIGGDEDYSLTLEPTAVFKVTKGIANSGSASALLIKDGAQIYQNATDVDATFVMNIVSPTTWGTDHKQGWQIIASPLKEASTNSFKPADSDYDLYKYDGTQELQWVNHKFHTTHNPSLLYDFEDNQLPEGFDRPQLTTTHTQWELSSVTPRGQNIEILRSNIGSEYCLYSETLRDDNNPADLEIDNWMILPEQRIVNGTYLQFETACYFSPGTMLGQYGGQYIDERLEILVSENVYDSEDDFVSVYDIEVDNGIQGGNTAGSWETYQVDLSAYAEKNVYIAFRHTKMTNANVSQAVFVDDIRLINENFSMFEESFVQGRGYMASYETETTATFTGELSHESEFFFKDVKGYNSGDRYENFYLLGNPFTFNMNWAQVGYDGIVEGYATVDADGSYQYFKDGEIKVGDGFFVQTIQNDPYVEYTSTRRRMNDKYINIIAKGKNGDDNLIIDFSGQENEGFNKLENFNDEIAELYILDEGYRYAIKNFDDDTEEVDFRFDAKHLGNYTISALTEGEFETVILVDKTTGIETNLLVEDYTFTSTADEAKDRFILKFADGQQPTVNGQFAYQSGGELIINAQGTVQIVDVLGRVVYQNEHSNDINRINVENLERASYVVRCVNGNEVKTQKIVVL